MDKKIVLILLVLLSACTNNKSYACNKTINNSQYQLTINSINDDISSVYVRNVFEIPYETLLDEDKYNDLNKQLDSSYHLEDKYLIREYEIFIDNKYSFSLTLDELRKDKYYCERIDA